MLENCTKWRIPSLTLMVLALAIVLLAPANTVWAQTCGDGIVEPTALCHQIEPVPRSGVDLLDEPAAPGRERFLLPGQVRLVAGRELSRLVGAIDALLETCERG